jgi:hypothetical protein
MTFIINLFYEKCPGDSGSALYDEQNEIVVGVASFGVEPFNDPRYPSVFARISAQVS